MNRFISKWIVFATALLAATASYAQVSCTREGLRAAADLYLAAQSKGDIAGLPRGGVLHVRCRLCYRSW